MAATRTRLALALFLLAIAATGTAPPAMCQEVNSKENARKLYFTGEPEKKPEAAHGGPMMTAQKPAEAALAAVKKPEAAQDHVGGALKDDIKVPAAEEKLDHYVAAEKKQEAHHEHAERAEHAKIEHKETAKKESWKKGRAAEHAHAGAEKKYGHHEKKMTVTTDSYGAAKRT